MKLINFFIGCVKKRLSEEMAYKSNFIISMMTLLTFNIILPFVTILIYLNTEGFKGWSFDQILLFQGIYILVNSIDSMFFQRVDWTLSYDVRSGYFDRYLLYPINTLAYISFTNFSIEHIADFVLGIVIIIYSLVHMATIFTIQKVVLFFGFFALALIFVFSLAILKYAIILKAVKIGRLGEFFRTVLSYGQYPIDIYGKVLSTFFKYLLPLAVIAYFPSKVLLDFGISNILMIISSVIIILVLCILLWNNAIKNYTSAGG